MNNKVYGFSISALLGAMLFLSPAADAKSALDGSSDLTCAAFEVVGCTDADNCTSGSARKFDLPEFMEVRFKKKVIHITYDGGDKQAESPINNSEINGSQLVLQGVENGHGWTMAVNTDNGRMSIAAVSDELTFTIFGACKVN